MGASSELWRMPVVAFRPSRTLWHFSSRQEPPPMSRRAVQRFYDEGAILLSEAAEEAARCADNGEALDRLYGVAIEQLMDIRRRRGRPR